MTAIQIDPFATASQMVAALRDREVSAVELLELHLRRIERHNPALNAIVTPDYDAARVAAANADTTRAEDGAGRLLGLTPLEFGSDVGGSIRIPAAFCGLYGHKPSETALARSGHFPGSPHPNPGIVMVVQGPLARSAEDVELALDVVAGPDVGEDAAWRLELPAPRHLRLSDYRVAVMPAIAWLPVDDEIGDAIERLASTLSRAGARVQEALPRSLGDPRRHHEVYATLLTLMTSLGRSQEERGALAERMRAGNDQFGEAYARGLELSAADYILILGQRELFRRAYREFFEEWDVLLAPVTLGPAFEHTTAPWPQRTLDVNGQEVQYGLQMAYPAVATLTGQPATAFPAGLPGPDCLWASRQ